MGATRAQDIRPAGCLGGPLQRQPAVLSRSLPALCARWGLKFKPHRERALAAESSTSPCAIRKGRTTTQIAAEMPH
jgi:hypothetical protein